jgi:hypothetical protein
MGNVPAENAAAAATSAGKVGQLSGERCKQLWPRRASWSTLVSSSPISQTSRT